MTRPYQLIVFDWEGTLGDSLGHLMYALRESLIELGLPAVEPRLARKQLLLGVYPGFKRLFPGLPLSHLEALIELFQTKVLLKNQEAYLLPGAKALVESLSQAGFDLAIATNKGSASLKRALVQTGLEPYFKYYKTASDLAPKPAPDMLQALLDIYGLQASQAAMVGDSIHDIQMACSLNTDALGVNFYQQDGLAEQLLAAGATAVFDEYDQLSAFFLGN